MEWQGLEDMAIIQKWTGDDWKYVGNLNMPHEGHIVNAVWAVAEQDRGVAYRAVEVRKKRNQDTVTIKELTPILCAATFDVQYEEKFSGKPVAALRPNLR